MCASFLLISFFFLSLTHIFILPHPLNRVKWLAKKILSFLVGHYDTWYRWYILGLYNDRSSFSQKSDSNWWPAHYKWAALPTELFWQKKKESKQSIEELIHFLKKKLTFYTPMHGSWRFNRNAEWSRVFRTPSPTNSSLSGGSNTSRVYPTANG